MPGKPPRIVVDACVLAGTIRRHLVLSFAEVGLLTPVWSTEIIHETRHAIPKTLKSSGIAEDHRLAHADQIVGLIQQAFPAAIRKTPSDVSASVTLPDPDDTHVLALAIETNADIILTENLKDFPHKALAPYNIKAMNTANGLANIITSNPTTANKAIDTLARRLGLSDDGRAHILGRLKSVGLKRIASTLSAGNRTDT